MPTKSKSSFHFPAFPQISTQVLIKTFAERRVTSLKEGT